MIFGCVGIPKLLAKLIVGECNKNRVVGPIVHVPLVLRKMEEKVNILDMENSRAILAKSCLAQRLD